MSRKRKIQKKTILPDPKYNNILISKFINHVMKSGKKSIAQSIVYSSLSLVYNKIQSTNKEITINEIFNKIIQNVSPIVEVKSRRIGGSTYQVPVEVNSIRQQTLAMRWIIESSNKRKEKGMNKKISEELFDAFLNQGMSVKKKENTHKMAEANKAFAHFRW